VLIEEHRPVFVEFDLQSQSSVELDIGIRMVEHSVCSSPSVIRQLDFLQLSRNLRGASCESGVIESAYELDCLLSRAHVGVWDDHLN